MYFGEEHIDMRCLPQVIILGDPCTAGDADLEHLDQLPPPPKLLFFSSVINKCFFWGGRIP